MSVHVICNIIYNKKNIFSDKIEGKIHAFIRRKIKICMKKTAKNL